MFIQLTDKSINDDIFESRIDDVKRLYWPRDELLKSALKDHLPGAEIKKLTADKRLEKIDKSLETISEKINDGSGTYRIYGNNDLQPQSTLPFPFLDRLHYFFLTRKWREPHENPCAQFDEYLHLHPQKDREKHSPGANYSANVGNYHHFVNVVAALSRLIRHFTDESNVKDLFTKYTTPSTSGENAEQISRILHYNAMPGMRKFMLMAAGFYHDIGKTVTNPRHGMEGAIILAFHTSHSRAYFNAIVNEYKKLGLYNKDFTFERSDLFYISNLVLFHDQYGTIQTGEDSYLRLADMISELSTQAKRSWRNTTSIHEWAMRNIFDLWLLNVADIMVSQKNKWENQSLWLDETDSENEICNFLSGKCDSRNCTSSGSYLIRDLLLSLKMVDFHYKEESTNKPGALESQLYNFSRTSSVERIRRLITSALKTPLLESVDKFLSHCPNASKVTAQKLRVDLEKFLQKISAMPDDELDLSIVRAIQSVVDVDDFCCRLAWIGKMDYALGFFEKLATAALTEVACEITGKTSIPTGWIRRQINNKNLPNGDYLPHIQAQFFIDNFAAIIIQILSYLLLREESVARLRNIQFSDAEVRLTKDKYSKILSLDGPFRSKRSVQLLLQTIYVY